MIGLQNLDGKPKLLFGIGNHLKTHLRRNVLVVFSVS